MKKQNESELNSYLHQVAKKRGMEDLLKRFKRDYTYSDGLKINLEIIEVDPQAPTVIFIPGVAVYALCYAELLSQLADSGVNVIGFDPRGHGFSDGERGDFTLSDILKDAQSVLTYAIENFNENISVMGARQGGVAALYLAAADDRINSVICNNLADLSDRSSRREINYFSGYKKVLKPVWMGLSYVFPKMSFGINRNLNVQKEDLRFLGDTISFLENDPLVLKRIKAKTLRSFMKAKPAMALEEISTPVFVIQSEKDDVFPLDYIQKIFSKLNCKKKLKVFTGLSSNMMFENVKELSPPIMNWLSEIHSVDFRTA